MGDQKEDNETVLLLEQIIASERRVSSRLSSKKRPYYGSPSKTRIKAGNNNNSKLSYPRTKGKLLHLMEEEEEEKGKCTTTTVTMVDCSEKVKYREGEWECVLNQAGEEVLGEVVTRNVPDLVPNLEAKSAHQRVKETIRIFNKYYLHLVQFCETRHDFDICAQDYLGLLCVEFVCDCRRAAEYPPDLREEEQRCRKVDDQVKNSRKSAKSKVNIGFMLLPVGIAYICMIDTKTILYPTKRYGALPGVEVGHQFYSRAEMVAVGLHSHWLNGIDSMGVAYGKLEEYKSHIFPLATSIVMSGVYEDDLDNSEDVVYTGQGGNNLLGDLRQVRDQVMLRGNLGLKNSMEQSVPVRVIRGLGCASSYTGKVYTYDGLYKVVQYWAEKGVSGFTVFKYRLRRIEGQPVLTTSQVQYIRAQAPRSLSELRGLVCNDISGGQEKFPVPASNMVDNPPVAPTGKFSHLI
ncbi:hypothetical protein IFM89_027752 [Coptis chinensis]|uniref:YDG domain-containing protein n=1 Tax=Coptis chinensis TaxID=261450 RepID=A0A835HYH8_9MAGN|nr:hypothetical protein IFM89_027752 [Coptis chinensis]